jgi:predicted small secreted protein
LRNASLLARFHALTNTIMNKKFFAAISFISLGSFVLSSCDTPTGQGAAAGAGAGAIIGGLASGGPRGALIGAAAGAATGALIGHAIQEDRARQYGPPPAGGYPVARYAGRPGFFYSPYTQRVYDLRGVPPGGLTRDVDTGHLFRRP